MGVVDPPSDLMGFRSLNLGSQKISLQDFYPHAGRRIGTPAEDNVGGVNDLGGSQKTSIKKGYRCRFSTLMPSLSLALQRQQ
jgi:hypothetical protein